jgi:23S rRNA pseudouridine1911/1915/1917 synthase
MKRFKQKSKQSELGAIVYEDIDLVIFEKAVGVLSYPLKGDRTISAIQLIRKKWKDRQSPNRNLYLIHRLDQDTSGLMVFAKTTLARRSLAQQFHDHSVIRGYISITQGIPNPAQGRISAILGRQFSGRRGVTTKGRHSITDYVVQKSSRMNALVYCSLHTGRTHQVRIHMAHLGTPVVGDRVYGKTNKNRMMLHAQVLGFHHPRSNRPMVFVSSLPAEFRQAMK